MQRFSIGFVTSGLLFASGCNSESLPSTDGGQATDGADSGINLTGGNDGANDADGGTSTGNDESPNPNPESSSEDDGPNCGEADFVLASVPPNVVLVLDKSGSMVSQTWDHDGDSDTDPITRWNSLYTVTESVLNQFADQINFGAVLFPSEDAVAELSQNACVVDSEPEVPVATNNGAAILAGLPAADDTTLQGATPATAGIDVAVTHLQTLDPTIPRFMILITDGAANCGADASTAGCPSGFCEIIELYDENLPITVGTAADDGIPTFVVGIDIINELLGQGTDGSPEANTFDELNTVAEAGQRAQDGNERFFNTQNEADLNSALSEIAAQVVSCVIPLDPEPQYPTLVEVEVGGAAFEPVDDCDSDGWRYVNPDGPYDAIELCGAACDALAQVGTMDATYGCPPAG